MKFIFSGKSLNELYKEYGKGANGFYSHWWKDEKFADEKPEAGEYDINIEKKQLMNLTFKEQEAELKDGWEVPHPAVLAEALLSHFKRTGECLMPDWYSRTVSTDSNGFRVNVGACDSDGVIVSDWSDGRRVSIGVSASRKFKKNIEPLEPLEPLALEKRLASLEEKMSKIEKMIRLP